MGKEVRLNYVGEGMIHQELRARNVQVQEAQTATADSPSDGQGHDDLADDPLGSRWLEGVEGGR